MCLHSVFGHLKLHNYNLLFCPVEHNCKWHSLPHQQYFVLFTVNIILEKFQFLCRRTSSRNSNFRNKWSLWTSFSINRFQRTNTELTIFDPCIGIKILIYSCNNVKEFNLCFSFSEFTWKKRKNGKKSILAITTFLSISAFDFFLLSKQAFLKKPLLKTTLCHMQTSCYTLKLLYGNLKLNHLKIT